MKRSSYREILNELVLTEVEVAAFYRYTLVDVVCVEFFLKCGVEYCAVGAFDPERVARHEGFAECNQVTAFGATLGNPVDDFCQSRIALEPDRSDLAQRDGERFPRDRLSRNSTAT